jgi:hypothetical protein
MFKVVVLDLKKAWELELNAKLAKVDFLASA